MAHLSRERSRGRCTLGGRAGGREVQPVGRQSLAATIAATSTVAGHHATPPPRRPLSNYHQTMQKAGWLLVAVQ